MSSEAIAALVVAGALVTGGDARAAAPETGDPGGVRAATRIVSLAPSVTEILFAIGAGDRLVGVCSFCDRPPEVAAIARVGTFTTPSIESILAVRPDLLVAVRGPATMDAVAAVRRIGVDTLVVEDTTLDAVWAAIDALGARTGRTEAAASLTAAMRGRFDAIRDRVAGARRRRVLVVVGQTPLIVAGGGTFVEELIEIAGGTNVAADTGQPWARLGLETVLARAPEVIIDTALSHEEGADPGLWARFPTLPAVREGRVHAYHPFAALRGGPRLADAAEEFARLIHPERYAGGRDERAGADAPRDAAGGPQGARRPPAPPAAGQPMSAEITRDRRGALESSQPPPGSSDAR
jgi:iron complex transport system substrate-binding protein